MIKSIVKNVSYYLGGLALPGILAIPMFLRDFVSWGTIIGVVAGLIVATIILSQTAKTLVRPLMLIIAVGLVCIVASIGLSYLKVTIPTSAVVVYYVIVISAIIASVVKSFINKDEDDE